MTSRRAFVDQLRRTILANLSKADIGVNNYWLQK
jgi:hypothetical protein